MGNKKLRWGIIGCANIAIRSVIPGMLQSETAEIVAIASRGLDKAQETAKQFGIQKAYGDYESLLQDREVEAVYIPLPNHLHREWTIRAAQAGKHVLCEKPLALTAAEAEEMVTACREAGVLLAEAFMYRHQQRITRLREVLANGDIGEIRLIRGSFTVNNATDWGNVRYVKEWGGGSILDVGCYPINAGRFIMGQEPVAVTVHAQFSPEHDGVDMMAAGTVEFENGVSLLFDCGMWADFRQTVEVIGSKGTIQVPATFLPAPDQPSELIFQDHGGVTRVEKIPSADSYMLQADDFAYAVWGQQPLRFEPSDAVANMRVLEACLASAEQKARIVLG